MQIKNTNAPLKTFCIKNGISFIDNSGIKEFNLGQRKLCLNQKGNSALAKNCKQDKLIFFSL